MSTASAGMSLSCQVEGKGVKKDEDRKTTWSMLLCGTKVTKDSGAEGREISAVGCLQVQPCNTSAT